MDQNKIIEVLTSKPHNIHYLNRYVKFIQYCIKTNNYDNNSIKYEDHHICPKADDLFPEYKNLNVYSWNKAKLTTRQHIVAHVLLWKAYPNFPSQMIALEYMIVEFPDNRNIPTAISIRYAEKLKQEYKDWRKGRSTYVDENGNRFFLHRDDPKIKEQNLISFKTGQKQSQETLDLISETKRKNPERTIKMFFLNYKRKVKINTPEFDEHLAQGWTTKLTKEDKVYVRSLRDKAVGKAQLNRKLYAYPDGTFYGKLNKDDPVIKEKYLIPYVTDKMKQQRKTSFQEGAQKANTGSEIYNNGIEEKKFKTDPGEGWVKGRLPRNESHSINHTKVMKERMGGSTYWTNGEINIRLPKGQLPDGSEWRRGFVRKKNKD